MQKILHKNINKLYQNSGLDEREFSKTVYARKDKLEKYAKLRSEGCSQETALEVLEISKATYCRWKREYKKIGLSGLEPKSKSPKKRKIPKYTQKHMNLVLSIRRAKPLLGKAKIAVILKREYNINFSSSTIGRILKYFFKKGIIQRSWFFYGRIRNRKPREFKGHAQRWQPNMKAKAPGEFVEVDHTTVHLDSGVLIKHFKAICPITKITVAQAYLAATAKVATEFLELLRSSFPFKVKSIKVDGGSEFRAQFEDACKGLVIDLYVIPPRSPECNGCVERCNSTVKYEFYYFNLNLNSLELVRQRLKEFLHYYNTYRPHQALNYFTPMLYFKNIGGSVSNVVN